MSDKKPIGPIAVQWAFIIGVNEYGHPQIIDHGDAHEIQAKRVAVLDDIYAASFVAATGKMCPSSERPASYAYTCAFLVFQMPDGYIAASTDVFEDIVPVSYPSNEQVLGAFGVLQGQIIAQKAADMAAPLALQATLSVLKAGAEQANKAAGKSEGGLYVA